MSLPWAGTRRMLLRGGVLHSAAAPFASAMLIDGDRIAWLGDDTAADVYADAADEIVDLGGRLVTPGFVDAHVHLTDTGRALSGTDDRESAQRAARAQAAALGIVALHEMGGPDIAGADDLAGALRLARDEPGPVVTGYWAEPAAAGGVERAQALGAAGAGGDLFVDGSLGSRTACLHAPDADQAGALLLDRGQVAAQVVACVRAGLQAGFHAIGDAAVDTVIAGVRQAADEVGEGALRSAGVRIEHAEMAGDDAMAAMAALGITASSRAAGMSRFADLARAGVLVAFGSAAPTTPLGPWAAVRAAVLHHQPGQRISARAAFNAHTRAGWRAAGILDAGVLAPGAMAHLAVWEAQELTVQVQDDRYRNWSTDPRSATPGLPLLAADAPLPVAVRTIVAGRTVHDTGVLS